MEDNFYRQRGYRDREDYLSCLADDFNRTIDEVTALADLLGESEDFDGLLISLEDMA